MQVVSIRRVRNRSDNQAPASLTICVTGGAGFVGSHLCDALIQAGHRVVCLDNLDTGRISNVGHLLKQPGFSVVQHDIRFPLPNDLPRFDRIYNLACPASPVHYQADPIKTAMICAQGAMTVLERAHVDGARALQASTSEIYGDPLLHPQSEDYWGNVNPAGPRSCYDEGKRFAETLFTDYRTAHGVDARIVRIFNTYGPRMQSDDGRVISNFIVQALRDEPLTLYGDGSQTRSFCFVDDLVRGLVLAMEAPIACGPVNLGNPAESTVAEIALRIIAMTGSASSIVHLPLPVDDPRRRRPDISRARQWLGWTPQVPLSVGLDQTISHFEDALGLACRRRGDLNDRAKIEAALDVAPVA